MRTLFVLAALALSTAPSPPEVTTRWTKVDAVPGFKGWRQQLQHMAEKDGHVRRNHFCIVAANYQARPPREPITWAYLYWRENAEIYTFDRSVDQMSDEAIFKLPLNLKTDVTRHPGSSTYLVTPEWVHSVLSHCASSGDQVLVERAHD